MTAESQPTRTRATSTARKPGTPEPNAEHEGDTPPGQRVLSRRGACGRSNGHSISAGANDSETRIPFPRSADAPTLADLLGITPRRVRQLAEDGHVTRTARGMFPVRETVQAYLAIVTAAPSCADDARLLKAKADEREHLAEKARHASHEARRRAELIEGKCINADILAPVLNEMIANARSRLLAIPTKAAPIAADLTRPQDIAAILTDAVHEALAEIANPGPDFLESLANRHREAVSVEMPEGSETDSPED